MGYLLKPTPKLKEKVLTTRITSCNGLPPRNWQITGGGGVKFPEPMENTAPRGQGWVRWYLRARGNRAHYKREIISEGMVHGENGPFLRYNSSAAESEEAEFNEEGS